MIVPEYDAAKIKYRGYTSYYLVDKATNFSDVKLVNKAEFTHHKQKRLFSLNNFNVKKAKRHVEIVKKLDMPTLQSNKKLLYATIIYYGISNLPIERWQELADKSSGWQINALPDGRKLVWSGKNITDDEKQLPPNYFKLDEMVLIIVVLLFIQTIKRCRSTLKMINYCSMLIKIQPE